MWSHNWKEDLKLKGSEQYYSFDHFNQQCGIKVWGKVNYWEELLDERNYGANEESMALEPLWSSQNAIDPVM
jgi:hypothetical protein